MDKVEKALVGFALLLLTTVTVAAYTGYNKDLKELELKYMAASVGAPLVVCVK
jgi:hypothetical protein